MTLHPGIDRATYEGLHGINWSSLKCGQGKTGMHIQTAMEHPDHSDTASTKFGRALHQAILQPEIFATSWEIKPGVKTTTVPGMLTESEAANINALALKFRALGYQIEQTELAMTWEHEGYGCKGSIDAITSNGILIDLKTTDDASPLAFANTAWRFGYHAQMAWYRQGLVANHVPVHQCLLIAMEKTAPHSIGTYIVSNWALERGEEMTSRLLNMYRDRTVADYPTQELIVPNWAFSGSTTTQEV